MYEISVIIPMFNVENFIENTLNSLTKQSIFNKMKIILVNDGSTDKSVQICQKFVNRYNNIILINKENGGVSSARNLGLNYVDTPYVGFVDSDDTINPNMYENMLANMHQYDAEFVTCNWQFKSLNPKKNIVRNKPVFLNLNTQEEMYRLFFTTSLIDNSVCDKLFKSEIVNQMKFREDIKIGEDMYFVYHVIKNTKRAIIDTSYVGYNYITHDSSAMHHPTFGEKFLQPVELSKWMLEDCDEEVKKYAKAHLIHEQCKCLNIMMNKNALDHPKFDEYLKEVKAYPLGEAYKQLSLKLWIALILMKISPKLYNKIRK